MTRAISIGFLLLYLTVYAEFHQLLKLPIFISHYYEHQQQAGDDLLSFINKHYFSNDRVNDSERDQQLPFKGNDCTEMAISIAVLPEKVADLKFQSPFILSSLFAPTVQGKSSSHQISVWQPPRV